MDALGEADLSAWRELSDSAADPNPFFDPDFALPAARHLDADVELLVAKDGPQWVGCLPVELTRGWRRIPMRGLVTWRHLYCFLGTPLLHESAASAAMTEMLEHARSLGGAFVGLDLFPTDGAAEVALQDAFQSLGSRPIELETFDRAFLERRADGDYLALSAKHRRNFERLRRRLAEDVGAELTLRDCTSDPGALDRFLEIEASGWKGTDGTSTAMGPVGHGDLFKDICTRLTGRGMLQLVSAEAGDATAAMLCNLIAGDTASTFKIAVQQNLDPYSPGVQLEILYLDSFHADTRLNRVDSCADYNNQMINRLWPDRRELAIRAVPGRGLSSLAATPILHSGAWLRRKVNR